MPRFITWHFPAFGNYRSWSVCVLRKRRGELFQQLAREVTWKRTNDARRFTDPLVGLAEGFSVWPTFEVGDAFVSEEEVKLRLEKLSRVVIPVAPADRVLGLDGETFGFAREPETRFEWWCNGPKAWKPLIDWTSATRNWLAEVCSRSIVVSPQLLAEPKGGPLPLP